MDNNLTLLKDIKAMQNIDIDFLSYYIGIGIFILFLLFTFLIYFYLKNKTIKLTKEQIAKNYLKNIDFSNNHKQIAYDFTIYGYECLNIKFQDEYESIVSKLENFKYKKDVTQIPDDLIIDIKEYIKVRL